MCAQVRSQADFISLLNVFNTNFFHLLKMQFHKHSAMHHRANDDLAVHLTLHYRHYPAYLLCPYGIECNLCVSR